MVVTWWHWGCATLCPEAFWETWVRAFESMGKVIETRLNVLRSCLGFGVTSHGGNLVLISTTVAVADIVTLSSSKEWIESLIKLAIIFRSFWLLLRQISSPTELPNSKVLCDFDLRFGLTSRFHLAKLSLGEIKRLSLAHWSNWRSPSRISCLREPLDVHLIHLDEELVNLSQVIQFLFISIELCLHFF